ncbi:MAG: C25 family cysteine peptidase [Verrucomicrobiota bacterium]|nr:C25 family cysteine peptidase [Verrucomicrobiota bacterium]
MRSKPDTLNPRAASMGCPAKLPSRSALWVVSMAAALLVGAPRACCGPERPWQSWLGETASFRDGPDLVFSWRTVNETGLIGFDVEQLLEDNTWERIGNDTVVAMQNSMGATYEVRLPTTAPLHRRAWRIIAWDSDLNVHASPSLGPETQFRQPPMASAAVMDSGLGQPVLFSGFAHSSSPSRALGAVPNGRRIKCATRETGWHRISADTIAQHLGLPVSSINVQLSVRNLSLKCRGEEVGYLVESGGAAMLFWAEPRKNNYTDWNVYWLEIGEGLAIDSLDGAPQVVPGTQMCRARNEFEVDIIPRHDLFSDPDDDYWFWERLVGSHPVLGQSTVSFCVDALASGSEPVLLGLRLMGGTAAEHHVAVEVNECTNAAWQKTWAGKTPCEFDIYLPPNCLREGTNRMRLIAQGTTKSQWYFDGFSLEHAKWCRAVQDTFSFECVNRTPASIGGFSSQIIRVVDITVPKRPVLVTNIVIDFSEGAYRASFAPPTVPGRYSAFAGNAPMPQPATELRILAGLAEPGNRPDLVIISPQFMLSAVEPLAAHRRNQGMEVMSVTLESVYDEFNDGISEPEAIRRFLRHARKVWAKPPAYVLLVGNGTYDYRGVLGKNDNLVPPLMVPTPFGLFASDSAFGDLEGDPAPEIAVGRLPVYSTEALDKLIQKIIRYETGGPRGHRRAMLAADAPDAGGDFVRDVMAVHEALRDAYDLAVAYPGAGQDVRQALLAELRAGVDLTCFIGHGAVDRLGLNGFLFSSDVADLANGHRLPVVLAMTCLAGQFSIPGYDCLAEQLVLSPAEGAVAVVSPTGLSLDEEASELNLSLIRCLKRGDLLRLGDYLREAMTEYNKNSSRSTPSAIYGIIGDPSTPYSASLILPPSLAVELKEKRTVVISLQGAIGQGYRISVAEALAAPTYWQVLTNIFVGTRPVVLTQPSPSWPNPNQAFYRAESLP